jgi:ABC-2 type transport system ATP-binding protein
LAYVETQLLTKRYGRFTALDGCTLGVERGEVFGLLGPNGAGKTTLLRLLLGMLRPTSGQATIDGLDCYRDAVEVHRRLSYLPGEARLFRQLGGRETLKFFCDLRPEVSFPRALELAERLDLDLTRTVALMSTGMRQKLSLVAALAVETPLVILDEPTSSLDPTVRAEVIALVADARRAGRTVMFSSHVLAEVEQVCDRVVILRRGQLVHTQRMRELRRQHRIRARLTGELPPPPESCREGLSLSTNGAGAVTIETPGELSPLLGWLAQAPLAEVQIEPVGLRAVYERFHPLTEMEGTSEVNGL